VLFFFSKKRSGHQTIKGSVWDRKFLYERLKRDLACASMQGVLSVKTRVRAVGNTGSRETFETADGPRSLGQRPRDSAHALASESLGVPPDPIPDQEGVMY
jgi:hypothetical protein